MLKFLKNIFTSASKFKGEITIQNMVYNDSELECIDSDIIITTKIDDSNPQKYSFSISDISDLKCDKNTLSFKIHDKKYKFVSEYAEEIFKRINPLIVDSSRFIAENINYFIL